MFEYWGLYYKTFYGPNKLECLSLLVTFTLVLTYIGRKSRSLPVWHPLQNLKGRLKSLFANIRLGWK
jgi:hypothetical protein